MTEEGRKKLMNTCDKVLMTNGASVSDPKFYQEVERALYDIIDLENKVKRQSDMLKERQPEWISVSEQKPKSIANKVIVYVEHEDLNPQIGYGHYEKYQGVEMWYNLETQEQFSEYGYTVTHWMPMPISPEGEKLCLY